MPPLILTACILVACGVAALIALFVSSVSNRQSQPEVTEHTSDDATPPIFGFDVRRVAPAGYLESVELQIQLAGRPPGWTLDRIFIGKFLLAIPVGLITFGWANGQESPITFLLALVISLVAFFAPELLIYSRAQERQQAIQETLPDTLDQMTIAVEAGLGFESAMAKAGTNGTGPLAEELIRTLQDMSIGRSRKDAYESLGARTTSVDLRRFTRSVIQADLYGIAIADVLRVQASELRMKRKQRAEEKAMQVPVKVVFPLIFCILPVLFIVLLTPAVIGIIEAFS